MPSYIDRVFYGDDCTSYGAAHGRAYCCPYNYCCRACFTEDGFWNQFSEQQKSEVMENGITFYPRNMVSLSNYTQIDRRRAQSSYPESSFQVDFPVYMLQGDKVKCDARNGRLFDHMKGGHPSLSKRATSLSSLKIWLFSEWPNTLIERLG